MGPGTARRWSAVLLAGLLGGAVLAPAPARAHGSLAAASPAQGSTVAKPVEAVSLTFTEKPAPFAHLTVTAPTGQRVDSGWSNAEPVPLAKPVTEYQLTDGSWQPLQYHTGFPVRITVSHWPAPGPYVVRYHSIASDGDQVKGEVTFTYAGAAQPAPAGWQPPTDPPSAELLAAAGPSTPAQAQAQAQPQAQAQAPADDTSIWLWLVPVLLVVAAGLTYLMFRPPPRRPARVRRR
jgi:methionine-rich copper-binding protein CopC